MSHLELVALVVRDYDAAIRFFVDVLQFELLEDTPSLTNDGRPKRWVVIRPDGGQTGILLARADGDQQTSIVGQQFACSGGDKHGRHIGRARRLPRYQNRAGSGLAALRSAPYALDLESPKPCVA
jgi:catechol 2,3-dioxygenase-like lactoylglutathione lyase family enzyme